MKKATIMDFGDNDGDTPWKGNKVEKMSRKIFDDLYASISEGIYRKYEAPKDIEVLSTSKLANEAFDFRMRACVPWPPVSRVEKEYRPLTAEEKRELDDILEEANGDA